MRNKCEGQREGFGSKRGTVPSNQGQLGSYTMNHRVESLHRTWPGEDEYLQQKLFFFIYFSSAGLLFSFFK